MFGIEAPFIVKSSVLEFLKVDLKIRPDAYFLVENLNSDGNLSIVFFNDSSKEILYLNNTQRFLINKEFLDKENRNFIYLSRGVKSDGKYIYVYGAIRYGKPKPVFLFRINPTTYDVRYYLFKEPPQALLVKLAADGKGKVLLVWKDEDKMPYRLVWTYSEDYMETYNTPQVLEKEGGISIFEPLILSGQPYVIYYWGAKKELILRNLLNGKEKVLKKLNHRVVNLKVKKRNGRIFIAIQEGLKSLNIYELDTTHELKELTQLKEIALKMKLYPLENFVWNFYDFEIVDNKPICVITAKFKHLPGVKVNSLVLPDKYNIFVNKGNTFYLVNSTLPFLINYTFPRIASDGENWLISYFGRKFIKGNVFLSYEGQKDKSDIALEPPHQETGFPKIINIGKNLYRLLYPVRKGDNLYLKVVDVRADKLEHYYTLPPRDILEQKLYKRIEKFIECQVQDDLNCIISMVDPVSRELFKQVKKINIDVLSYKCTKIILIENSPFAVCEGEIKHRIPKRTFIGIDKDLIRKIKTQDLWVYIDGEWYYVPPAPMVKYFLKW